MMTDRGMTDRGYGVARRALPGALVIGVHAVFIYVIAISMGVMPVPKVAAPIEAVFIPETLESEPLPQEPAFEPDIADITPTVEAPPLEVEFEEPVAPPAELPVPASDTAISARPAGGETRQLATKRRVEPSYPSTSRRLGEEGSVVLRVLVDERGRAQQVNVASSSGFARLDEAAVDAVRKWRFQAAVGPNGPIGAWTQVAVTFRLTTQ